MKSNSNLPFDKNNYRLMVIGMIIISVGFFIMTLDSEDYGYGFLGLTLWTNNCSFRIYFSIFCHFL